MGEIDYSKYVKKPAEPAPKTSGIDYSKYVKQAPQVQAPSEGWLDYAKAYGPAALRGAGGFIPPFIGYVPTGAIGNLLLETGAQTLEPGAYRPWEMASAAGLGMLPGGAGARVATTAAKGAILAGGSTAITQQAKEGLHIPTLQEAGDIAASSTIGGTVGVAAQKLLPKVLPKVFGKNTPDVTIPPTVKTGLSDLDEAKKIILQYDANSPMLTGARGEKEIIDFAESISPGFRTQGVQAPTVAAPPTAPTPTVTAPLSTGARTVTTPKGTVYTIQPGESLTDFQIRNKLGFKQAKELFESTPTPQAVAHEQMPSIKMTDPTLNTPSRPVVAGPDPTLANTDPSALKTVTVAPNLAHTAIPGETLKQFIDRTGLEYSAAKKLFEGTKAKTIPVNTFLPAELAKDKLPKYTVGGKSFTPQWDNDIDRALYVISKAEKTRGKNHDDYMTFLKNATGLDEAGIMAEGAALRGKLGEFLSKKKIQGEIDVPKMHSFKVTRPVKEPRVSIITGRTIVEPTRSTPSVQAGTGGTPPNIPPNTPTIPPGAGGIPPPSTPPSGPTPTVNISTQTPTVKEPWTLGKVLRQLPAEGRQLMTFGDLSFPFRQGITNIHKKEFWKSMVPMLKAGLNEGNYQKIEQEIASNPFHSFMLKHGLDIHDPTKGLKGKEEQMRGVILEGLGANQKYAWNPIRASNRAYTAFAHKLRADLFTSLVKDSQKAGIDLTDDHFTAIARFVNDTTGRGNLGKAEKYAEGLNELFFAPKLIASRVNMFRRLLPGQGVMGKKLVESVDPTTGKKIRKYEALDLDPRMSKKLRMEALKSMASVGALATTFTTAGNLAFNEPTTLDPTSPDFGKVKTGKTRFDVTGGFQPYVRTAAKVAYELADLANQRTMGGKEWTKDTGGRAAGDFLRAKLSPVVSLVVDMLYEETPTGEKFEAKQAFIDRMTPLIYQDFRDIMKEDPGMAGYTVPATLFGAGARAYGKDKPKRGSFDPRLRGIPQVNLP